MQGIDRNHYVHRLDELKDDMERANPAITGFLPLPLMWLGRGGGRNRSPTRTVVVTVSTWAKASALVENGVRILNRIHKAVYTYYPPDREAAQSAKERSEAPLVSFSYQHRPLVNEADTGYFVPSKCEYCKETNHGFVHHSVNDFICETQSVHYEVTQCWNCKKIINKSWICHGRKRYLPPPKYTTLTYPISFGVLYSNSRELKGTCWNTRCRVVYCVQACLEKIGLDSEDPTEHTLDVQCWHCNKARTVYYDIDASSMAKLAGPTEIHKDSSLACW